jgi:hypothetical protein
LYVLNRGGGLKSRDAAGVVRDFFLPTTHGMYLPESSARVVFGVCHAIPKDQIKRGRVSGNAMVPCGPGKELKTKRRVPIIKRYKTMIVHIYHVATPLASDPLSPYEPGHP